MAAMLAVAGAGLLLLVIYDVLRTVFDVQGGGGPLTGRLAAQLWRVMLALHRRGISHRVLQKAGLLIVLSILLLWLLGLWTGWTLVYASQVQALVNSQSGQPATFWERAYFASGTLFTLSSGDFQGGTTIWRLVTTLNVSTGLMLVTLTITYVVPVLGAASERRTIAAYISSLGVTPERIVLTTWSQGLDQLQELLTGLAPMLNELAQKHLAYPVLHYFHSATRDTALAPNIVALDEALTIFERGLLLNLPVPVSIRTTRDAMERFVSTLTLYATDQIDPPPAPDLGGLSERGLPTVDQERFEREVEQVSDHRRLLLAAVREDGWDWDDVIRDELAEETRTLEASRHD